MRLLLLLLPSAALRTGGLLVLLALLSFSGCSTPPRGPAVPAELTAEASIPGLPGIRYILNEHVGDLCAEVLEARRREREHLAAKGHSGAPPPAHYLALSGGGDNGAFGAGLLAGWTEAGNRPEFGVVTGISIGAMIAPFAFVGPSQDATLEALFTTLGPDDVYSKRSVFSILNNDALSDNTPMQELLEKYIDEALLALVAEGYEQGRWLLVATTNLDAARPVIWNMGKIAASSDPGALQLFRDILLASAAVPGAFPPVMIDVEAGGSAYQEMHVDGGTSAQVFLIPLAVSRMVIERGLATNRERHAYIIRNASLTPKVEQIERSTLDIFARSVTSLILTQGIGDLFRIYMVLQEQDTEFNLAFIRADFEAEHPEEFDTEYMQALYAYGRNLGKIGYPWLKSPQELITRAGVSVARREDDPFPSVALP